MNTSSCGMFSRIKFEKTWSTKCGYELARLLPQGRKNVFENKYNHGEPRRGKGSRAIPKP